MKFTAVNKFHRTECEIEVKETYLANFGGMVAVIEPEELNRVAKKLCGIKDCMCESVGGVFDENGEPYSFLI